MKVLSAFVLLALGAGCSTSVDTAAVRALAEKAATDLGVTGAKATCPDHISGKIGTTFVCSVAVGGKSYDLDGVVTTPPGQPDSKELYADLRWHAGVAVSSDSLAKAMTDNLTAMLSAPATVTCGEPIRFIQPDHTILCDVTAGAHKLQVATTFNAKNETDSFKLVPRMFAKAKLEELLGTLVTKKLERPATVTCGTDPLIQRPADGKLTCAVDSGESHGDLAISVDDDFAVTGWEIVAPGRAVSAMIRTLGIASAVAVMASAAACNKRVDNADFEARIAKRVGELGLPVGVVTCPAGVDVAAGTSFKCAVQIADRSYELEATITGANASGDTAEVTMETRWTAGDAIVASKLAASLTAGMSKTLNTPVVVDCGEPLRFLDATRALRCELSAGRTKVGLVASFDDKGNPVGWKLDPPVLAKSMIEASVTPSVRDKTATPAASVACGTEPLMLRPPDGRVPCTIEIAGKHGKIAVLVGDDLQVQRWEVVE